MAQSKIYEADELAALMLQHAKAHGSTAAGIARGWDLTADWQVADFKKAMGRSKKVPGAVWAIEQNLAPLVKSRNELAKLEQEIAALDQSPVGEHADESLSGNALTMPPVSDAPAPELHAAD